MGQIIVMPEPGFVVLIGAVMAFKFEFIANCALRAERHIPLWHPLKIILVIALFFAPLLLADWSGLGVWETAGRVICYVLYLVIALFFENLCR